MFKNNRIATNPTTITPTAIKIGNGDERSRDRDTRGMRAAAGGRVGRTFLGFGAG
jgi:hypothetical protein